MPREKKNSSKVKSPSTNQNGQPKAKKRRGSAAQQQQQQQQQNNPSMQAMQNSYQMNPYDEYSNPQQLTPNNNLQNNLQQQPPQMSMNGPPPQQQRGVGMQGGQQQMHNSYQMSSNGMMQQHNYPPPPQQMNNNAMNGQMNGPPLGQHNYPPPPNQMQMQNNMNQMPLNGSHPQMMNTFGKQYPVGQAIVQNPNNSHAPPIYPCGICRREVHESEPGIMCEAGCSFWYHKQCTNLTEDAFKFLKNEVFAEWVCEQCEKTRSIPLVKECKQ